MVHLRLASLRDRLLLLVLLTALPVLGLAVYSNLEERRLAASAVQADALRLARIVARTHEELIEGSRHLLLTLAQLPESRPGAAAECRARYAALLSRYSGYADIGVAGADGQVFCSARPGAERGDVEERSWFDRAVRTRAFAVGDPEPGPAGGPPVLVTAYPVLHPGGGTQAVVFAALDLQWLNQLVGAAGLPPEWSVAVSDESGAILARYPDPTRFVGQRLPEASVVTAVLARKDEGTAAVTGPDGIERFHAFTPLRGSSRRAYVSVSLPRRAAFADANRILARNLVGLGLVTIVALLAAWSGSDWIVLRRLHGLVTATDRLSGGDLAARAEVRGRDEIGTLARAFNAMAGRLESMVRAEHEAQRALSTQVDDLVAQRTHDVDLLNQMSELLQACLTPEEAYAVIGQLVGQFFPDESGAVFVMGATRDAVRAVSAWGPSASRERQTFGVDECWALRRGRIYQVDDCATGLLCQHLATPPPTAYVCVPLAAHGETLGVLHLSTGTPGTGDGPGRLSASRQRLAITIAEQFALALANLRLRETLRSQSIRDPLTGLFNRRYMEETLERELRRAERDGRSLAVVMLDIDRFKQFNDSFGHEAGDVVLAGLGGLLRRLSRGGDVACRYGGEEFILILPEATMESARRRADEIREAVRELQVTYEGRPLGPVRCSIGVSAFPAHGLTGPNLLRAADAALYRAKRGGRDQVVVAD